MPYPCSFCSVVPQTPASSIRHQRSHAKNNRTFIFFCPMFDCDYQSSSYRSLDNHFSLRHREDRHIDPANAEELFCHGDPNNCFFSTTSLVLLVRHLQEHLDKGLSLVCPIEGCSHLCKTKVALKVHLPLYHQDWSAEGCPKQIYKNLPPFENEFQQNDFEEDWEENHAECETESCHEREDTNPFNEDLIFKSIGKFYLSLYAEKKLAQTTIQFICDSITFLTEVAHARIKTVLSRALEDLEVSERERNSICYDVLKADLLYSTHHKNSSGPSVTSHYLRKKSFEDHSGYFGPIELHLDDEDPESGKKLQYVPVKKSLSVLFSPPFCFEKALERAYAIDAGDEGIVSDYKDGYIFKSEDHPAKEIQLLFHQDAYNPVPNVLGKKKGYKALIVYFTIGNLKPHLMSKIVTKHLAMIIRESLFKEVGAEKCLEELITDLKALEDGIDFMGETIPVSVEFMLGDSLGQHLIGGFIECFSAEFMCRFCVVTRKDMKSDPLIIKEARTAEDFDQCALRASLTGKSCKGIKGPCEFNKLKYFHSSTHLVPCIAHDSFEGAFSWDLSGVIAHFVEKKWFSYRLLNKRIKAFKCVGVDSPNKPAFVNEDGEKLGGHAVQNWTLIRLFYFIIGDKIKDFEDEGWLLYLKLKELCEYICVPSFQKSVVPYIQDVLLPDYFSLRKSVLGHQAKYELKPKDH
ncbi:LOW QUALITY PROTEIN: Zinc finger Y-chromosomal protein 1 [Frankliniella fusca]|uniref:Zinc finger Y-chromosomal protein 1 n=1 Tax=Frankliniella fusca TaxID=407009 RepID=A0AAE1HK38_9NEOP|nr:LOW QUALITY PROTEIN: Zinc finger Y-chromosomal protein 1 [Frankliniella fusca]